MKLKTKYYYIHAIYHWIFLIVLLSISNRIFSQIEQKKQRNDNKLILGVINYNDKEKIKVTYNRFINNIAKQVGKEAELQIFGYDDLTNKLINNEVDIAVFSPYSYIEAHDYVKKFGINIEAFAIHKADGLYGYTAVIIVDTMSHINSINKLKGARFLFTHSTSTSGYRLPLAYFRSVGIEPDKKFFKVGWSGDHKKSIQALASGKVDGIATYVKALEQQGLDTIRFRVLWKSDFLIPYNAYVFSPYMDESLKNNIKNYMISVSDSPILKEQIFDDNPLGIEQWKETDDSEYNELRRVLNKKRIKPTISFVIEKHKSIKKADDDLLDFVELMCIDELKACQRFNSINTNNLTQKNDQIRLFIANIKPNSYNYSIYKDEILINEGVLLKDKIDTDLPNILVNCVISSFNIETCLNFDSKDWLLTYGLNDGLNKKDYEFILTKEDLIISGEELKIDNANTYFPKKYWDKFKNNDEITIRFKNSDRKGEESLKTTYYNSYWNLDNIWGVIGIVMAIFTMLLTGFFQFQKHRRFKKMLLQANKLLKDYFQGEETSEKIVDIKATIGHLMETHSIKEIQYNVLLTKLAEIQDIIDSKLSIAKELKDEIEIIIADNVITEKEYQYLIHLINANKSKL